MLGTSFLGVLCPVLQPAAETRRSISSCSFIELKVGSDLPWRKALPREHRAKCTSPCWSAGFLAQRGKPEDYFGQARRQED